MSTLNQLDPKQKEEIIHKLNALRLITEEKYTIFNCTRNAHERHGAHYTGGRLPVKDILTLCNIVGFIYNCNLLQIFIQTTAGSCLFLYALNGTYAPFLFISVLAI